MPGPPPFAAHRTARNRAGRGSRIEAPAAGPNSLRRSMGGGLMSLLEDRRESAARTGGEAYCSNHELSVSGRCGAWSGGNARTTTADATKTAAHLQLLLTTTSEDRRQKGPCADVRIALSFPSDQEQPTTRYVLALAVRNVAHRIPPSYPSRRYVPAPHFPLNRIINAGARQPNNS